MKKERTISAQTRIDARDFCVLVEAYPIEGEKSLSAILRFYLESVSESLCKSGAGRPLTIADAIERIETAGFPLGQLSTKSYDSKRTRRAIERENMGDLLSGGFSPASPDVFKKMSDEVNERLKKVE